MVNQVSFLKVKTSYFQKPHPDLTDFFKDSIRIAAPLICLEKLLEHFLVSKDACTSDLLRKIIETFSLEGREIFFIAKNSDIAHKLVVVTGILLCFLLLPKFLFKIMIIFQTKSQERAKPNTRVLPDKILKQAEMLLQFGRKLLASSKT